MIMNERTNLIETLKFKHRNDKKKNVGTKMKIH